MDGYPRGKERKLSVEVTFKMRSAGEVEVNEAKRQEEVH